MDTYIKVDIKKLHLTITYIYLIVCFFSSTAFALGTTPWTKIEELMQGQGNNPIVKVTNYGEANLGCSKADGFQFIDASSSAGSRQFSAVLMALGSGKQVKIESNGCAKDGYPNIYRIILKQ